jgi:hypothetical protein
LGHTLGNIFRISSGRPGYILEKKKKDRYCSTALLMSALFPSDFGMYGRERISGLPDVSKQNTNLGYFWRVLHWKVLVYFMSILSISCPFGIFHGRLVCFFAIWYILLPFGIFYGHLVYFMAFCFL